MMRIDNMEEEITPMHYELLEEYKEQQYKGILTSSNVVGGKIHINKVTLPGGVVEDNYDFWGYQLQKDGERYLLKSVDEDGKEIDIRNLLPIIPEALSNVAFQGNAYKEINNPIPVVITPENRIGFRELIDRLNSSKSSNPLNRKLFTIISVMQRLARANVRVSTPPAFGKDSTIAIMDNIIGGCGSITNPTVAKLEYLVALKLLALNEVSSITKANWRDIQQFLLDTGDLKLKTNKRSRAGKGTTEELILKDLSISLYFNDLDTYSDTKNYFDNIADGNLKDRFPPFRFSGGYLEDFNAINKINTIQYVKRHFEYYKDIARTLNYFEGYFKTKTIDFKDERLSKLPDRWQSNMIIFIKGIYEYARDNKERGELIDGLFSAQHDYSEMLRFPEAFEMLMVKMKIPIKIWEDNCSPHKVIAYLEAIRHDVTKHQTLRSNAESKINYLKKLMEQDTFVNKNLMCQFYNMGDKDVEL
jgi:hypothetical protein